jgi:hypothetical protein
MKYRGDQVDPRKKKYTSYVQKARTMRPFTMNEEGSDPSTVRMSTETFDGKNWYSFPTIFPKEGNTGSTNPQDWIIYDSPEEAFKEAQKRGEVFDFGSDKESALMFGEGAWKPNEFKDMPRGRTKTYRAPFPFRKRFEEGGRSVDYVSNYIPDPLANREAFDEMRKYNEGGKKKKYREEVDNEPTYYGMLDTVEVVDQGANKPVAVSNTTQKFREQYPFVTDLTTEEQKFFNDPSPIGAGVRRKARIGKDKSADMMGEFERGAKSTLDVLGEVSGVNSATRFALDPIGNLTGAGKAIEKSMLNANPMSRSFLNVEISDKEAKQLGDTAMVLTELAGIVGDAFGLTARGAKSLLRFKGDELGRIYRQVGPDGFADALKENKIFSRGQKKFLENNPNFSYTDDAAKQLLGKPEKGFNLDKPVTASFFNRDKRFFPNKFKKGSGKTADSGVDYMFVSKDKIADESLIPRYRDQYRPDFSKGKTGVLKPNYNDLSNFNMYKLGEDGEYYRMLKSQTKKFR